MIPLTLDAEQYMALRRIVRACKLFPWVRSTCETDTRTLTSLRNLGLVEGDDERNIWVPTVYGIMAIEHPRVRPIGRRE